MGALSPHVREGVVRPGCAKGFEPISNLNRALLKASTSCKPLTYCQTLDERDWAKYAHVGKSHSTREGERCK